MGVFLIISHKQRIIYLFFLAKGGVSASKVFILFKIYDSELGFDIPIGVLLVDFVQFLCYNLQK